MSYLRGPLTREQIATLMANRRAAPAAAAAPAPAAAPASGAEAAAAAAARVPDDAVTVPPPVADGAPVRWLDPAAPWAAQVGAVPGRVAAGPGPGDPGGAALRRRQARPAGDRGVGGRAVPARIDGRPGGGRRGGPRRPGPPHRAARRRVLCAHRCPARAGGLLRRGGEGDRRRRS